MKKKIHTLYCRASGLHYISVYNARLVLYTWVCYNILPITAESLPYFAANSLRRTLTSKLVRRGSSGSPWSPAMKVWANQFPLKLRRGNEHLRDKVILTFFSPSPHERVGVVLSARLNPCVLNKRFSTRRTLGKNERKTHEEIVVTRR
jgi:hypothetical protein